MSTYWVDVVVTLALCLLAFTGWLRARHWRRLYRHAVNLAAPNLTAAGVLDLRVAPPTWRTPLRRLRYQWTMHRLVHLTSRTPAGPPTIVHLADNPPDPDRTEPPA